MEAKELSIGNIISYRGETECIVTSLGSNGFETVKNDKYQLIYGSDDVNDYEPIPLTTEWLVIKFGFEKIDIYDDIEMAFVIDDFYVRLENGKFIFGLGFQDYNKELPFVHKLQNLYFEIKDKELMIK